MQQVTFSLWLFVFVLAIEAKTISNDVSQGTKQIANSQESISSEDINDLVVVEPAEEESTQAAVNEVVAPEETSTVANTDDANAINRFCKCSYRECNCCRQFRMPIALLGGAGCAKIRYMDDDKISVGLSFGDRLVASRVISSRKATPICMPLPGGYSKFCGRIYGISRRSEQESFQACLGLELRADDEIEAALRVSCFNFSPKGLEMTEAQPLPPSDTDSDEDADEDEDSDEDGDDDDLLGGLLGGDGDADDGDADEEDDDSEDDYR